jgi:hypothetical protein
MRGMPAHDTREFLRPAMVAMGLLGLAACEANPSTPPYRATPAVAADLDSVTRSALSAAAAATGIAARNLEVISAEAVTWPDGSLGCPQPGMMYTQALVPGYRVRIRAGGEVLDYHAGRTGQVAPCPADRARPPLPAQDT